MHLCSNVLDLLLTHQLTNHSVESIYFVLSADSKTVERWYFISKVICISWVVGRSLQIECLVWVVGRMFWFLMCIETWDLPCVRSMRRIQCNKGVWLLTLIAEVKLLGKHLVHTSSGAAYATTTPVRKWDHRTVIFPPIALQSSIMENCIRPERKILHRTYIVYVALLLCMDGQYSRIIIIMFPSQVLLHPSDIQAAVKEAGSFFLPFIWSPIECQFCLQSGPVEKWTLLHSHRCIGDSNDNISWNGWKVFLFRWK